MMAPNSVPSPEILPVSLETIGNISQLTVDARALHTALKVGRDFSNWIKDRITKYGFVEGEDYEKYSMISRSPDLANGDFKGLRQAVEYRLSLSMGKELAMVENNEIGRLVRRYFITCEQRAMQHVPVLPDFSNPALAARAWAEQYEQRQIAEAQRNEAIRTKAEIGSRREATAMATASAATRKANTLEDKLGFGKNYKQVKAIPWLLEEFVDCRSMYQQVGKKLTVLSQRMGYAVKVVPCPEYPQGVKAYHVDVVNAFLVELRRDQNMLGKYRLREAAA